MPASLDWRGVGGRHRAALTGEDGLCKAIFLGSVRSVDVAAWRDELLKDGLSAQSMKWLESQENRAGRGRRAAQVTRPRASPCLACGQRMTLCQGQPLENPMKFFL
ncbi:hypothetical protein THIX_60449 [Thiomonas sp. X19]|nr:hypothetical protein THIX_60449 [Thiomonas sp. X19]